MTEATACRITPARWPEDAETVRALLRDYGRYLANSPGGAANICLDGYEAELRTLPGKYADILLGWVSGRCAGCVALAPRKLADGSAAVEMKRLWVDLDHRGLGLGRQLVTAAIAWARSHDCDAIVLDTVEEAMPEAARLYGSLGFQEVGRFNDNQVPGVRFYELRLRGKDC